ncbi:hypothetical protein MT418_004699 [Batrachochytrium dendrobatidis]
MDPPSDGDLSTSNSKGNTPHESIKESGSDAYKQPSAAQSRQRSFNESTLPKLQDTTSQPLQQRQKSSNSATDSPLPNLYPFENKQDTDASKVSVKPNTSKNAEYTAGEVYSSDIMPIAASPASAESISSPKHDANPTLGTAVPTTTQESGRIDNILVAFTNEKNAYEQEFAQMEAEFHAIHAEADPNADIFFRFLSEYKKVFVALSHSKSHAYELGDQFIAVQRECLNNDQLQVDGVKTLDHDQQTLKTLKVQIKRAEQMFEQSLHREEVAKNDQRQIKNDIISLTATIKQGVGLSAIQERTINELIASKEQMTKDLELELNRIVMLRNGLTEISEEIKMAENLKRDFEKEIFILKDKNSSKKLEIDNELRGKERLERELRELRTIVTVKSQEVQGKQDAVNRATEDMVVIEGHIKQQRQQIEKLLRDQESLGTRTVKLQQDYDEQMSQTSQIMDENETTMNDLKIKERELANHRAEIKKVTRIKEVLLKKNRMLEHIKVQAELERKVIRAETDTLMVTVDRLHRQVESMRKNIDDLSREKDILSGTFLKTQNETQKITNLIVLQKQQRYNIELEIAQYRKESLELHREAKRLAVERDKYVAEAIALQEQCVYGLRELKNMEFKIFENKRQLATSEAKYKHQQNLYEAVQSERNLHAKHLIESQGEIAEMKRKLKIMNFQINGYKDDLNSKDATLAKENTEHIKLKRDMDMIRDEIKTLKNQNELAQVYIRGQIAEQAKLNLFVKEAEVERSRQENALHVLVSERDNLSSQLIRRNDELTSAYDKIKTKQLELLRGEMYYQKKLCTIRALQVQIHELRHDSENLAQKTSGIKLMRKSVVKLQNELTQEQTRITALEQELENPINVHRWRKLEGSNPKAFDMIQLLHTLQKKLITKTKEDKEKKEFIKIQEELYLHLKNMLMKQVGPEALEQIEELETQFKNKSRQLRHMDTELNMYQAQVREYKYTIGQLDASLAAHKKQFLSLYHKRVDAIRNGASVSIQAIPHSADKINLPMLPEKPQSASQQNLQFTADMQLQDSTLAPDEVHDMNSAQAITDSITEPQEQLVVASAAEIPNLGTITI